MINTGREIIFFLELDLFTEVTLILDFVLLRILFEASITSLIE